MEMEFNPYFFEFFFYIHQVNERIERFLKAKAEVTHNWVNFQHVKFKEDQSWF